MLKFRARKKQKSNIHFGLRYGNWVKLQYFVVFFGKQKKKLNFEEDLKESLLINWNKSPSKEICNN